MRIGPPVIAIVAIAAFMIPSYLKYEPHSTDEFVSWKLGGLAALSAIGVGLAAWPSAAQLQDVTPQIAYLAIPGAVVAVLTWNAAIGAIGPQNAVLFSNLIPVTTFVIEIVRGYRPNGVEVAGAALTIAALVANNLFARRVQARREERVAEPAYEPELSEAA